MPTKLLAFLAALVVAFFVASGVADRGDGGKWVLTGTLRDYRPGEWLVVKSDQTDPQGVRILLDEDTDYRDGAAAMKLGDQITVWSQNAGENRSTAVRVQLIAQAR